MENKYYYTIGLEIHMELKTKTKMFCSCKNNPEEKIPNTNICPICMAHPGALPVPNKKAIENVIKLGLALGGEIADFTEFDRKNYFYPDIPKGYQISQYKYPIVSGGKLFSFNIERIHIEEDTANNKHDRGEYSLIDFNRAGIPLAELVTKTNTFENKEELANEAYRFGKELQLILQFLDISSANMEKGEMRVEANISLSKEKDKLGTKVEIKNLNSFKFLKKAILYELNRMEDLANQGKENEIIQETMGFNEKENKTFVMRIKESSSDYRYFPDPDLPKMYLHKVFNLEEIKNNLGQLPESKRLRYSKDFNLNTEEIEYYLSDRELLNFLEELFKVLEKDSGEKVKEKIKIASNYLINEYLSLKKNDNSINLPKINNFKDLVNMVYENKISSRNAKDIFSIIIKEDTSPTKIAEEKNLLQENNTDEIKVIVEKIINENKNIVDLYKGGKEAVLMSLVGKVIKESGGSANPQIVIKILKEMVK